MSESAAGAFKLCVDVHYLGPDATVAGVLFQNWEDSTALGEVTISMAVPSEYEPGAFYKRELPCILELLAQLPRRPSLIIIDGYVWLGQDRPGLGHHLFAALDGRVPVIGVAKNWFHGIDESTAVLRGMSKKPLFVTAEGMDPVEAIRGIEAMHGPHRVPTLLKRADQLCRGTA